MVQAYWIMDRSGTSLIIFFLTNVLDSLTLPRRGWGYTVTRCVGDGNPAPLFEGEPYLLPLNGSIRDIADELWSALDENNRVSLAVKFIDVRDEKAETHIINKYRAITA